MQQKAKDYRTPIKANVNYESSYNNDDQGFYQKQDQNQYNNGNKFRTDQNRNNYYKCNQERPRFRPRFNMNSNEGLRFRPRFNMNSNEGPRFRPRFNMNSNQGPRFRATYSDQSRSNGITNNQGQRFFSNQNHIPRNSGEHGQGYSGEPGSGGPRWKPIPPRIPKCNLCGRIGHLDANCKAEVQCKTCYKFGHDDQICWFNNTGYNGISPQENKSNAEANSITDQLNC